MRYILRANGYRRFLSGRYDRVVLAYNDFVGAAKQIPRLKQILPVDIGAEDIFLGSVKPVKEAAVETGRNGEVTE